MTDITPLGVAALALLVERPMHAYEVYQTMLHRREDRLVKVRPGSLYHTIDRLAAAGYVEVCGVDREGNRPERTSYAITQDGRSVMRDRVRQMLGRPAQDYPEFPVGLSQAHNLPADEAVRLLTDRLHDRAAELEQSRELLPRLESEGIPRRYLLDGHYRLIQAEAEVAWLEQMIAGIRDGTVSWSVERTEKAPHI